MRVITTVALGILVSACASGKSSESASNMAPPTVSATQTIVGTSGATTGLSMTTEASSARLAAALPLEQAWTKLQAAYATLGIKATTVDQQAHLIGNNSLRVRRKVGDVPLITAMNCGTSGTGPNSESYELTLTFQSRVTPTADGVMVETFINGTGQNPLTNTGNTVPCYSMGAIEKRIVALMMAK